MLVPLVTALAVATVVEALLISRTFNRRLTVNVDGSSPRARGTETALMLGRVDTRFIPACAGNSPCRPDRPRSIAVHPRVRREQILLPISMCRSHGSPPVRGEQEAAARHAPKFTGSSPRARETVSIQPSKLGTRRFIPACVGNRNSNGLDDALWCGSSPRARGTVATTRLAAAADRFIPACAGNRGKHRIGCF